MVGKIQNRLLFKSDAKSPMGRVIDSAEVADAKWTLETPMRILGSYAVVYILEGRCRYFHPEGVSEDFEAGDLMVLFPDVPHSYGPTPGHSWSQFYIRFEGETFDSWRRHGVLDPARFVYHLQPVSYWLDRFRTMVEAWPVANPFSIQPICSLLAMLAEVIESHGHSPAERENVVWLQRAYELLVAADWQATLEMESVAAQMDMSYANFRKKFTALARMSPARYHALLVMHRACRLMHAESISSKEVADRLGFCDRYYFSRRFKQIVGVSPGIYRQRLGGRGKPPAG
jgi:AraC-like DNA-binding protein